MCVCVGREWRRKGDGRSGCMEEGNCVNENGNPKWNGRDEAGYWFCVRSSTFAYLVNKGLK